MVGRVADTSYPRPAIFLATRIVRKTENSQASCVPDAVLQPAGTRVRTMIQKLQCGGRLLFLLSCLVLVVPVQAAPMRWAACSADGFPPTLPQLVLEDGVDRNSLPAQLDGDAALSDPLRLALTGGASMERGDQRLAADTLVFNRQTNVLTADGSVRVDQGGMTLFGDRARMDVDDDEVRVFDGEYYYRPIHGRGTVGTLLLRGDNTADLESASYTTCPVGDRPFWSIHGDEVRLNSNTGRGEAENAVLRLGGVPVFYTPYASFPIDDRRHTGLLPPRIGTSNNNGFDLTVPFYWNIAPERDLTLYPRYMDRRGLMLGGEYRYLGRTYSGDISGAFLSNDKQTDENRYAFSWQHFSQINRWVGRLDYNKVSDKQYLDDFGDSLLTSSASYLPQLGQIAYQGNNWRGRVRLQKYQTIDETITARQKPYELLPEVQMIGRWVDGPLGLTYHFDGEATAFDHQVKTEGNRLNLFPGLSLPVLRSWGHFIPKVSLSVTKYNLDDNPRGDTSITRTAPVVSVDSGLVFERPVDFLDTGWKQTLEPRLYYLYVPYRNQDDIPLFDTSRVSEDYYWMFRENRFTGPDRLGDANQLTVALTSRMLSEGAEKARFSIGQIRYFANRRVELNPRLPPQTVGYSDLFADASVSLFPGWTMRGAIQWNVENEWTEVGRLDLRYTPIPGSVLGASYRYTRDDFEQIDLAGAWRLNERWRLMGRYLYSLEGDMVLEGLAGLEYESCCWLVRVAGRHYRNGIDDPTADNALYVELELKGLGGLGTNLNQLFAESINGYERGY